MRTGQLEAALRLNAFLVRHFGSIVGSLFIAGGVLSGSYVLIAGERELGTALIAGLSSVGVLAIGIGYVVGRRQSTRPRAELEIPPGTDAPLPTFLARRYGGAGIFALPLIAALMLLAFGANVVERYRILTRGQIDAVLIVMMWLLVILTGYVMLTPRRLGGPLGRWQNRYRAIPTWFVRWRRFFRSQDR